MFSTSISEFFWESYHCFHSGYTNLHSYEECTRFSFFPYAHQHFLFIAFSLKTILIGVRWDLDLHFMMLRSVKPLFKYLLAMYMSLGKYVFSNYIHLKPFLLLSNMGYLYLLYISLLSDVWFSKCAPILYIAFHFVNHLFCCVEAFELDIAPPFGLHWFLVLLVLYPKIWCQHPYGKTNTIL